MNITVNTKKLGVIGWPIAHSLSPAIHNRIAEILKLDFVYLPFAVTPEGLKAWVDAARTFEVSGFNVTMPHKTAITVCLDGLSDESELFGAVNTVTNRDGELIGHNTDAEGLRLSAEDYGFTFNNAQLAVIGAGGAARAIILGAIKNGAKKVTVYNRTPEKAESVKLMSEKIEVRGFGDAQPDAELIINTVPSDVAAHLPCFRKLLRRNPQAGVIDICYAPPKTELLKIAQEEGTFFKNGLDMLICQAILSLELFLDRKLDVLFLKNLLSKELSMR